MSTSVERVRDICKKRGISISSLEKSCGFANGYLNPKKQTKLPYDRAIKISQVLDVSVDYLLLGEEKKTPSSPPDSLDDSTLMFALWGDAPMDEEDLEDVKRYAAYLKSKKEASS